MKLSELTGEINSKQIRMPEAAFALPESDPEITSKRADDPDVEWVEHEDVRRELDLG